MKNQNMRQVRRLAMTGISAVCLVTVTTLWAAEPTTAPSVAAPMAPAVVAPATDSRTTDQSSNNNRRSRGRNNGGAGNNGRGSPFGGGGGGGAVSPNDPYGVLQTRSIFVKGNQNLIPATQAVRPVEPRQNVFSPVKPNLLIFNGVTIVDGKPEAFVEDLGSNMVGTVKPGDAVAGGAVVSITFEELTYQAHGQTMHVGLGEDFNGNAAFALAPAAPTTQALQPTAPGQVVGAGASIPAPVATPSGISAEDILARMKAKRAQESQQIGGK